MAPLPPPAMGGPRRPPGLGGFLPAATGVPDGRDSALVGVGLTGPDPAVPRARDSASAIVPAATGRPA